MSEQKFNGLVLVERKAQLGELLDLASGALAGQGQMVFLGGEAGVGKSALTRALVAEVTGRLGVRVGGVDNLTTADAFAAFADALPEIDVSGKGDRLAVFRAILARLASAPTLLVLEDLHWADEATLDAVRFLGRRMAAVPVLVVATYRHDEVSPRHPLSTVMGDLAGLPGVHRMQLPPLTVDGVAELIAARGGALDAAAVHGRTGGNAFFVTEVLTSGADGLPDSIRDAVLARVARLSDAAAEVVAAAAVLGTPSSPSLLDAVSGTSIGAVDEALERGVLVTGADGQLAFRHELARQAVDSALSALQRRQLHRRALARLTERDPTDHRALAHHALGAGDDGAAVTHASAAAARAARLGAHREAVAQYQLAVRAMPGAGSTSAHRAQVFEALSYECYLTGQLPEAITARGRALELFELQGDLVRVGDSLRWLSRLSWFLGRNEDAERYGARAVATLENLGDNHERAMAYSNYAQLRMLANDDEAARTWGLKALELARELGDREVEIHALNNVGASMMRAGQVIEGEALLKRSLDLALAADAHEHAARAYTNLGAGAAAERRYAAALPALAAGVAYCEERDLDSWVHYMQAWQVVSLAETGAWDDAVALAVRLLARPDLTPVTAIPAAAAVAQIEARRGQDAHEHLSTAAALAHATGELQRIAPSACAEAEAAWLAGRSEDVGALTAEAVRLVETHPDPWVRGELLWWRSLAPGTVSTGAAGPVAEPFALMLAGRWPEAAAAWQERGCPHWVAYCLGLDVGAEAAQRGLAILESLGAEAAVNAVLRTRRERDLPLPRRPRAATRANGGGLTTREQDVLRLLAEGLSTADMADRLVLSPRTVEHHVSAVLRKLGEPTRARAVAAARRLELLDA